MNGETLFHAMRALHLSVTAAAFLLNVSSKSLYRWRDGAAVVPEKIRDTLTQMITDKQDIIVREVAEFQQDNSSMLKIVSLDDEFVNIIYITEKPCFKTRPDSFKKDVVIYAAAASLLNIYPSAVISPNKGDGKKKKK